MKETQCFKCKTLGSQCVRLTETAEKWMFFHICDFCLKWKSRRKCWQNVHCHKKITGKIDLVMSFMCIWKLFLYGALPYFFSLFLNLSLMIIRPYSCKKYGIESPFWGDLHRRLRLPRFYNYWNIMKIIKSFRGKNTRPQEVCGPAIYSILSPYSNHTVSGIFLNCHLGVSFKHMSVFV